MRQLFQEQLPLTGPVVNHRHAQELDGVDRILMDNPDITALVLQDLEARLRAPGWGRKGMTAEQVLRAAIVKQLNTWTYEELSFHLADSWSYRTFCRIGALDRAPSRATLQRNIKGTTEETWHAINRTLMQYAAALGVHAERGRVQPLVGGVRGKERLGRADVPDGWSDRAGDGAPSHLTG